jgi:hypothetical protein
MTAKTRLIVSLLAGALAGAALTWFEATKRHAALAAAVAKLTAHGHHHESATRVLATGFAVTTLAVGLLTFIAATAWQRSRDRRALAIPMTGRGRRGYGSYGDYGGGW